MASVKHNLEYALALSSTKFARMLSPKAADRLAVGLGNLVYRLSGSRRDIAYNNLKMALGDDLSDHEIREIVHRVFQNVARSLIEFARFGKVGRDRVRQVFVGDDRGILAKVHAGGKGAILTTAHYGNWELTGSYPALHGYPVDFLVGDQHNEKVDNLVNDFRRQIGVGIISAKTGLRSVFKCLKENRILGISPDQHAPSGRLVMNFFGRPASVAKGAALFAIRANSVILPVVSRRERYDRHVITFADPIYPPDTGDEEADIRTMVETYNRFFEAEIRKYPDQWMWTHRRWKLDMPGNKTKSGA